MKPGWPYVPGSDHLSIKGAADLADRIHDEKNIDFMVMLGDFIYADVPSRVDTAAAYAKKYRQTYASKDWRRVYENIPTIHVYDDHEIRNDYAGGANDSEVFQMANSAYSSYVASGNPDPITPGGNYYAFNYGDTAFFAFDTRRYRSSNDDSDDEHKTMLGTQQKAHFINWLSEVNQTATFKFVISSVPFMTLWSSTSASDTWSGFMSERDELMDILQYVPNVIVISGDRHEFAAATIRDSVVDFSISPLSMFWLPIRTLSQSHNRGATGEDRLLNYTPRGKRKFGTFEVDTRNPREPLVSFKLYVDGAEKWSLTVIGKQVVQKAASLPGSGIGRSLALSLSELLGLGRGWF